MVSIEERTFYTQRVNESLKLKAFHQFLLGNEVSTSFNNITDLEEQFFKILFSIQTNNKTVFQEIYIRKSKSNPSKNSPAPFVNDDYLIFCLIIAITKFGIDKTWIRHIISIRNRNIITITFENILNENYSSTSNQLEVILIFLNLCKQSSIDDNLLNAVFKSIIENTKMLENRNDFEIFCTFRAYDLIVEQKEANVGNEITLLKQFSQNFKKRIKILSWFLQGVILFSLIYGLFKLPIYSPEAIKMISDYNYVFTIIGAFGFTILGNQISFIKDQSQQLLMRLFGYPKELI